MSTHMFSWRNKISFCVLHPFQHYLNHIETIHGGIRKMFTSYQSYQELCIFYIPKYKNNAFMIRLHFVFLQHLYISLFSMLEDKNI